ncbi:hypothetical protein, variant [Aphanomyces astaci]|uniref:RCC1-like domain-containing protein n=1 Tax=Aphanomyces astaci TaxID=112090 RepID=W4FV59_APHAT|nr:hypothetical protein, variant [Aphanomyces astaci]ETV70836.1 hypothetical protein, variant [Aphanomyces astaci]|eukprot:XP_009839499.1 hypothetical protein, variant [Aphanomyces astaci]
MMLARAIRSRFVKQFSTNAKPGHYNAFVWGDGTVGQLGLGPVEKSGVARKYTELGPRSIDAFRALNANVSKLSLGTTHSAAVDATGRVYTWGFGEKGELGLGDNIKEVDVPTWVEHLDGVHVVDVSCAVHHTAALDNKGRLFTWGYGGTSMSDSALGLGPSDGQNVTLPTLVETFIDDGVRVQAVDCGDSHTVALSADGEIWTWGRGDNGRLGNGELISLDFPEPLDFFDSMTCVAIAAGRSFSLALRDDGRVFGWGKNNHFQLGLEGGVLDINNAMERIPIEIRGFEGEKVVKIAAGTEHAAALTETGKLFVWGANLWVYPNEITPLKSKRLVDVACGDRSTLVVAGIGHLTKNIWTFMLIRQIYTDRWFYM